MDLIADIACIPVQHFVRCTFVTSVLKGTMATHSILKRSPHDVHYNTEPSKSRSAVGSKLRQSFVIPKPSRSHYIKVKSDDNELADDRREEEDDVMSDAAGDEEIGGEDADGDEDDEVGTDEEIERGKIGEKRKKSTISTFHPSNFAIIIDSMPRYTPLSWRMKTVIAFKPDHLYFVLFREKITNNRRNIRFNPYFLTRRFYPYT